ncbi:MAG: hypothetical protein ACHQU0_03535 [Candidatus Paceibacteria bacterium]
MVHAFSGAATKAVLHVELSDGSSYDINFSEVHRLEIEHGIEEGWPDNSMYRTYRPTGISTLHLVGRASQVVTPAKKAAKPAPKPKKPSIKACVVRVQKATVSHAKLTKKINDAETALKAARVQKEQLDAELKTAREQLLASATPETR